MSLSLVVCMLERTANLQILIINFKSIFPHFHLVKNSNQKQRVHEYGKGFIGRKDGLTRVGGTTVWAGIWE